MLRDYETVLKAAADPTRARILKMLQHEEMCVCQIVATLELSQSTVSKHLSLLRAAGLIDERKDGRWLYVRLSDNAHNAYAPALLDLIRGWLDRDATIRDDAKRARRIRRIPAADVCEECRSIAAGGRR